MRVTIRRAIRKETTIEACCPIKCTCGYRDEKTDSWRFCGWFGGATDDATCGSTIKCKYDERSRT